MALTGRVGGRHRYEQPAVTWRNQVLLDFDYTNAVEMEVSQGGATTLRFVRDTEAQEGDEPMVRLLLDARADPEIARHDGDITASVGSNVQAGEEVDESDGPMIVEGDPMSILSHKNKLNLNPTDTELTITQQN